MCNCKADTNIEFGGNAEDTFKSRFMIRVIGRWGVLSQWPFYTEWLHTLCTPWPNILHSYKVTAIFRWGTGKGFLSYFQVKTVIGDLLHLETFMLVGRRKAYRWKSWRGRGGGETGRKSARGRGLKCCCRVSIVIKWHYCIWCYHYIYSEVSRHYRYSDVKSLALTLMCTWHMVADGTHQTPLSHHSHLIVCPTVA